MTRAIGGGACDIAPSATMVKATTWPMVAIFALTTFFSAVLLFLVQPLIGKFILPWFGGTTAVWTTCLVFFQTLLFAGYVYAHTIVRWLGPRGQLIVHGALLLAAIALLPITPNEDWRLADFGSPALKIMALLTLTLGLPYLVLSATSPLIQSWWSWVFTGTSPYRLYALSNVGSLSALLLYPFLVEPRWDVGRQTQLWSWVFVAFCALCLVSAAGALWRASPSRHDDESQADEHVDQHGLAGVSLRAAWVLLPGFASLVLMATTNFVCQMVAPVPFLWVLPLALYLLTFIVCFDRPAWYRREIWATIALVASLAIPGRSYLEDAIALVTGIEPGLATRLLLYMASMFSVCMVCHGELYRLRPRPQRLTEYYLFIAAGGALGGAFVSLVAPVVFSSYFEWNLAYFGGFLLACGAVIEALHRRVGVWAAAGGCAAAVAGGLLMAQLDRPSLPAFDRARSFYGLIEVFEVHDEETPALDRRTMQVDGVTHGKQLLDPQRRMWPTWYYGPQSGVGLAIRYAQQSGKVKLGGVGLGVGAIAAYTRDGDLMRFYEINAECERLARKHFTFIDGCAGQCEVVLGDARLTLEREPPRDYDVLVLDAFSGHAVPTHLLTEEAFEIYRRHLKPEGIVAVHITNHYIDLAPVLYAIARRFELGITRIENEGDGDALVTSSDWLLLSRDRRFIEANPPHTIDPLPAVREIPIWTDRRGSLYELLRWQ